MDQKTLQTQGRIDMPPEVKISAGYFVATLTWIVLSDSLLDTLFGTDARLLSSAQTLKGLFFVVFTTLLFYLLLSRQYRLRRADRRMIEEGRTRFGYLFMHNPLPMWVYDVNTLDFLAVNDTAVAKYGYSREEFMRMTLRDIRPPEDVPRLLDDMHKERPTLQFSGEWRHRLKNGDEITVEIISHRLRFDDRDAVLVVAYDVTERKRLEAELEEKRLLHMKLSQENELRQARNRFISMISHEFRKPLAMMSTSADLLERYGDRMDGHKRQGHFNSLRHEIKRLADMTDDILTLLRSEFVGLEYSTSPLNLDRLCSELVAEIRTRLDSGFEIVLDNDCPQPTIQADEKLLRYAIDNLLSNAVKYSRDKDRIWLQLLCHDEQITVAVRDEGIGIPPESLPALFEPFYRAPNVGKVPGTGLGLAIVRQAVELHGGSVSVESQVGAGSTFSIHLPRSS
jgi:PAS domain S-box-containing protein